MRRLSERQKTEPTIPMGNEKMVRQGSFKISSKTLSMLKQMGMEDPGDAMFTAHRELVTKVSRQDLAKVWGVDNIPDAQDVIARNPKKAMRTWMKNIGKVVPRLARGIRKIPENIPLWFYVSVKHISGREMADEILKRYLTSTPSQAWRGDLKGKKQESMSLESTNDLLGALVEQLTGDENDPDEFGMDPMTNKRLKVKKMMQRTKRHQPKRPISSHLPYGLRKD